LSNKVTLIGTEDVLRTAATRSPTAAAVTDDDDDHHHPVVWADLVQSINSCSAAAALYLHNDRRKQ
jgi:hypothetical protein